MHGLISYLQVQSLQYSQIDIMRSLQSTNLQNYTLRPFLAAARSLALSARCNASLVYPLLPLASTISSCFAALTCSGVKVAQIGSKVGSNLLFSKHAAINAGVKTEVELVEFDDELEDKLDDDGEEEEEEEEEDVVGMAEELVE